MLKRSSSPPSLPRAWLVGAMLAVLASCATGPDGAREQEIAERTRSLYERGIEAMQAGEYEAAIETFRAVSERNDELAGPYANIGIAYRALEQPEKAKEALLAALERDPGSGAPYNQLGLLHRRAGRFDKARSAYQQGLQAHPEYAQLYRNLGILCDIYLQEPKCALRNYESYQSLSEGNDEKVKRWIADVERRVE